MLQPAPAPRFERSTADAPRPAPAAGAHTDAVLAEAGFSADDIAALHAAGRRAAGLTLTHARRTSARAASLLVLRDGPRGVEVLMMRRPERGNDFRSGACVFPGGVLDAADAQAQRWCVGGLDDAAASRRLGVPQGGLDYFIAAVRECFEEVGLLFVCRADGSAAELDAHAWPRWRDGAAGCTAARRRWRSCARPSTGGSTCATWPTSRTG